MLEDTPRKLLRILYHFSGRFKRLPSMPELERLSGRMPVAIRQGMKELAKQNYIEWNPHAPIETAVIIEGWERNVSYDTAPPGGAQSAGRGTNIDYWLYH